MLKENSGWNTGPQTYRFFGISGWIAIVFLSVLPGSARPHSGASGVSEHFVAYAAVAFCLWRGTTHHRERFISLALLVVSSGVLELVQIYIPGRTAELKGLLSAAAGAVFGAIVARFLPRIKFRT